MLSVNVLQWLDRYLGIPLCLLLTLTRFLFYPFWNRSKTPKPARILIIKLSNAGSTLLAYPALEEIRKRIPGAEIFYLVFNSNRAIIDTLRITRNENIITVATDSLGSLVSSCLNALARLRRESIDTTIDMSFFSRFSAIMAFLVCRGNRVGFHRFTNEGLNRGRLLTHEVIYSPGVHTSIAFMSLVNSLFSQDTGSVKGREQINKSDFRLAEYLPDPAGVERVKGRLRDTGIDVDRKGSCLVLMNPDCSDRSPLHRWPLENFISLSSRLLSSRSNICIVFIGTESERQDIEAMVDAVRYPRCVSFAGRTAFKELLVLYSIAEIMITNDSGQAHFAALARLPSIVLFGPEAPALSAPLGEDAITLNSNFACSPCMSANNHWTSPCRRSYCLEAISVDTVLVKALSILDNPEPG